MRDARTVWLSGLAVLVAGNASVHADGGWLTQEIPLQQGWNLIWIGVDPMQDDPATLLQSVDYESIWSFVPGRLNGDSGQWVRHVKDLAPEVQFLNTLERIQGDRGYLIKANVPGTLSVVGHPVNRAHAFSSESRNLYGAAHTSPAIRPTSRNTSPIPTNRARLPRCSS